MTVQTHIFAEFAGRRRKFELTLGGVGELERRSGAGIGEIMLRLGGHTFKAGDIVDAIALGLEGGGASEAESTALVTRYVIPPMAQHLQLAIDIVVAFVNGLPEATDDQKKSPENETPETSPTSTKPGGRSA